MTATDRYTPSSGMYNRENGALWKNTGTAVDGLATAAEAITAAGLDWDAIKVPVFTRRTMTDAPLGLPSSAFEKVAGKYAVERSDTGEALGIVGNQYQPIQNREAFDFMDALVDSGDAKYETAGSTRNGRRIWLLAKMPDGVQVAGEDIDKYLLLSNPHDGTGSLTVAFTPLRVICTNILNLALAEHDVHRTVRIRHSGDTTVKLEEARSVLGIGFSYFEELAQVGEELTSHKLDTRAVDRFLRELVPDPTDRSKSNARAVAKRESIRNVYLGSDNLNNVRGTAWGVYNAVAEYEDHFAPVAGENKAERRFTRAAIQPQLKNRAEAILLAA